MMTLPISLVRQINCCVVFNEVQDIFSIVDDKAGIESCEVSDHGLNCSANSITATFAMSSLSINPLHGNIMFNCKFLG